MSNFINNIFDPIIFQNFFEKNHTDLIILDIFFTPFAIVFKTLKINFVFASTIPLADDDEWIPPLDVFHIPEYSNSDKNIIRTMWKNQQNHKKLTFSGYTELLREISQHHQFDFDKYFYWNKSIVPFGFDFPELIFWDSEFDFPRTPEKLKKQILFGKSGI